MEILGVRVDNLEKREILEKIESFLSGNKFNQIATVNPEFILQAQKDEEFKNILNSCDLNIVDGVGIKFAFWRYGEKLKARIAGVDLMEEILKMAGDRGLGVFLIANKNGLSSWEETVGAIKRIYPNLRVSGNNINLGSLDFARDDKDNIKKFDIIFANFGAPYQEKFLRSSKSANIRLAMGVGGSFDYFTGKIKRAPKWMRQLGLEWLWRLILEPKYRFKRIFRAIITFPIKILFSKKTNE